MWYVSDIIFESYLVSYRGRSNGLIISMDTIDSCFGCYELTLTSTEGESVELVSTDLRDNLIDELLSYNPYGIVKLSDGRVYACIVDKQSMKFASLISGVARVSPCKEGHILRGYPEILCWPEYKIVRVIRGRKMDVFSPILHLVCLVPDGWSEDGYYFETESDRYRISFEDYDKAYGYVSKLLFAGYNPLGGSS